MLVYVDSSALIKRVVDESESDDLESTIEHHATSGDSMVTSTLARIEVSQGLMKRSRMKIAEIAAANDSAIAGVSERSITPDVVRIARTIGPLQLRSLDAIHLATAVLLDADLVIAYDERLLGAYQYNGLQTASPGK